MAFKVRNEIKIGILVVAAILMLVLGLNFLKGKKLFSDESQFFTFYDNVEGLQESAVVQLNGFTVGRVSSMEMQQDQRIKVGLTIRNEFKIPVGSEAELAAADLISGTKIVSLRLTKNTTYLQDGAVITGKPYQGILGSLSENVSPLMATIQHTIGSIDSLVSTVNELFDEETASHLNQSMVSLNKGLKALASLSESLNEQSENLSGVIQNTNSVTGNLAANNEKITNTFTNLESFSQTLSQAELDKTMADLQKTAASLQGIISKVDNNTGTLGMLLNDKRLYENLSGTLSSLDTVLTDLRAHPYKYINVSVFGRK